MLESALLFQPAFERLEEEDRVFHLVKNVNGWGASNIGGLTPSTNTRELSEDIL